VTGIICGIYGGSYIASVIPGCSRELMLLIILGTSFAGRTLLGLSLQVAEKKFPVFLENRIEDIEDRISPQRAEEDTEKREKETVDKEDTENG
jgi:hypothetical protein